MGAIIGYGEGYRMLKYYVTYQWSGGTGAAFVDTCQPYNTQKNLESLIDYLSKTACNGKPVIILNLIKLEC